MSDYSVKIAEVIIKSKLDAESLTTAETAELGRWLEASSSNRELYDRLGDPATMAQFEHVVSLSDHRASWDAIEHGLRPQRQRRRLYRTVAAAVVAAVVVGATYLYMSPPTQTERFAANAPIYAIPQDGAAQAYLVSGDGERIALGGEPRTIESRYASMSVGAENISVEALATAAQEEHIEFKTLVVPRGGMFGITLEDGTQVKLNSGTELRFPERFAGGAREVWLSGEAWFEVAHNDRAPFIVHSGEMTTRVLGTKFNVSAYPDDQFVSTTLAEGSVEVAVSGATAVNTVLRPGMQATLLCGTQTLSTRAVDLAMVLAWQNGELLFGNMELERILRVLSRWYDVDYEYSGGAASGSHTFAGRAARSEDLETVLRRLTMLGGPRFEIVGRRIIVH
ncbi:MAG: FecR domain-containing protein [Rikenellaceae bacterium]|nr:FecR domain-containing protein [Rikenellaceae bacterium]MCL2692264.1 FecR domain-containing protein [Rikenellaceae bacterium]